MLCVFVCKFRFGLAAFILNIRSVARQKLIDRQIDMYTDRKIDRPRDGQIDIQSDKKNDIKHVSKCKCKFIQIDLQISILYKPK